MLLRAIIAKVYAQIVCRVSEYYFNRVNSTVLNVFISTRRNS